MRAELSPDSRRLEITGALVSVDTHMHAGRNAIYSFIPVLCTPTEKCVPWQTKAGVSNEV